MDIVNREYRLTSTNKQRVFKWPVYGRIDVIVMGKDKSA